MAELEAGLFTNSRCRDIRPTNFTPPQPTFRERCSALPGLTDVNSDVQMKNPQVSVSFDRDKASALGVNITQMEDTMYSAFGQRQVSTIYTSDNQYRVILEVEPEYQRTRMRSDLSTCGQKPANSCSFAPSQNLATRWARSR